MVDEAREAGIEHFIFVTGRNKAVIEGHFDRQFELELTLRERGKRADLRTLSRDLPGPGTTSFTRQQSPLGLGTPCGARATREPFALLLPDVLVQHEPGCVAQMIEAASELAPRANIIAVEEVAQARVNMYGVVGVGKPAGKAFTITGLVEKLPAVYPNRLFVAEGCLASYGPDFNDQHRRAQPATSIASSKAKSRPTCQCRRRPSMSW